MIALSWYNTCVPTTLNVKDTFPSNAHPKGNALGSLGRHMNFLAFKETMSQRHSSLPRHFHPFVKKRLLCALLFWESLSSEPMLDKSQLYLSGVPRHIWQTWKKEIIFVSQPSSPKKLVKIKVIPLSSSKEMEAMLLMFEFSNRSWDFYYYTFFPKNLTIFF